MPMLPDLRDFASVLIVKPSSLGDIVHALPVAHAIKAGHPRLKLSWIAKPEWLPIIDGSPDVDTAIPFPQKEFRGLAGKARALAWAASWNKASRDDPELILDLQGLLRSALIGKARGSHPVIGLSDAREGATAFYDHVVNVDANAHAVDRYLALPGALGVPLKDIVFSLPEGEPIGRELPPGFVLVHPWSRGAGKSLATHELQVLCDCLTIPVVIVGVNRNTPPIRGAHVTDLTNQTTLPQLIWIMRQASAVISVDSGPMHIAAAVNDATIGIHTWSDPRKVGPYSLKAWTWKAGRIARRSEFTAHECETNRIVTEGDARRLADFAHRLATTK